MTSQAILLSGWTAIAVKASLAMLLAMLLVRLMRRASASLRHLAIAAAFGTILFLPVAGMLVPARVVRVKTLPQRVERPSRSVQSTVSTTVAARRPLDLFAIAFRVYFAGVALLFASLSLAVWRLHRLRPRADLCVTGTRLANETARRLGMRTGIEVAITTELAVPVTFGFVHPVILLPGSTKDWSDEELGRAIRHELEHIGRGDWATQIFARMACALYWPHPFVWVLWQRLRLEAERACDDAVIRSFGSAEPYAAQLVSLAKRMIGGNVPALSMATRSNLGVRIDAILDQRLRRNPLTRLTSLAAAVIAAACMLTVAPYKLMSATIDRHHQENIQSADEADPLDMALLMAAERNDRSTMQRLMDRGATANAVIQGDGSPLIAASRKGHVEAMTMLIGAGADVNRGVEGDGNPLIAAASGGHVDAVRLLLDRGAKIDEGVEGDGNALIAASGAGHADVVRFLLDRGASIEKVVNGDENALIHASEAGQVAVVRMLIVAGANVNARVWADFSDGDHRNGEWRTALSMAKRNQHDDVVRILREAGVKD